VGGPREHAPGAHGLKGTPKKLKCIMINKIGVNILILPWTPNLNGTALLNNIILGCKLI